MKCPDCGHATFVQARKVYTFAPLLWWLLARHVGWIAVCAQCARQYEVARDGITRLGPAPEAIPAAGVVEHEDRPPIFPRPDPDMPWSRRRR